MSHLFATLTFLHPRTLLQWLDPLAHDCRHLLDAVTAVDGGSPSSSGETFCGDAPQLAPSAWVHVAFVAPPHEHQRLRSDARRHA